MAVLLLSEALEEKKTSNTRKTCRGKTRDWIRRGRLKQLYNNIVKELILIELEHGWIQGYDACVTSILLTVLFKRIEHCWVTHRWPRNKENIERKVWALSSDFTQQRSTPLNTAQFRSTGCTSALNMMSQQCWALVEWTCWERLHGANWNTFFLSHSVCVLI